MMQLGYAILLFMALLCGIRIILAIREMHK
jgi:hypothetical protein